MVIWKKGYHNINCKYFVYEKEVINGKKIKAAYCISEEKEEKASGDWIISCLGCEFYKQKPPFDSKKITFSINDNDFPPQIKKIYNAVVNKYALFIHGSVGSVLRNCGKPSCRTCTSGKLHKYKVLRYREKGKQKILYLKGRKQVKTAQTLCKNYKEITNLLKRLSSLCIVYLENENIPY